MSINFIDKCLFPVAGYGTRFLPATKALPKEMLPIVNTPLIQFGVEEALSAGMHEIAFVTGRTKRAIEDYFDVSYELEHQIDGTKKEKHLDEIRRIISECTFSFTRQPHMKGLGHSILTGETLIGNVPFGVVLADDLCINDSNPVLSQMVEVFNKYKCSVVGVIEVGSQETSKYGIIDGKLIKDDMIEITKMVEKPKPKDAPSNLAIIGRYILTPDIFEILKNTAPGLGGEIQLTDAILTQARKGKVIGYKIKGKRFDCGSIDGYIDAMNYVYLKDHKGH